MCAGLLAQLPDEPQEPKEPKPAVSLEQEFSINATIYSARAWLSNDDTFAQDIWKATNSLQHHMLASPSFQSVLLKL